MSLVVDDPGLQTTLQGRKVAHQRHLGMPFAGPADPLCHAIANWLVYNEQYSSALEITLGGARFTCISACSLALSGAASAMQINQKPAPLYTTIHLQAGDTVRIGPALAGCRSYLAISGGFRTQALFDSGSTFLPAGLGGLYGRAIMAGDRLLCAQSPAHSKERHLPLAYQPHFAQLSLLRATEGPEHDRMPSHAADDFWMREFTVGSRGNRIGMLLEGPPLDWIPGELASAATFPGTVQCPPSAVPFLLAIDAQTTGGYPRIAQVIRSDRHLIGQLRPGQRVRIIKTKPDRARQIHHAKHESWRAILGDTRLD